MNQKELIDAIADKTGMPKKAIDDVLKAQADIATAELYTDGEVTLPGLGKLTVKVRAARDGRNPKTGETVHIPVKRVPHFGAAKALKDAVATTI